MDTRRFTESDFITKRFVNESKSKILVIISSGHVAIDSHNNEKFECAAEMDSKQKKYRPNVTTMLKFQEKWGYNSEMWAGKPIKVSVGKVDGKEAIIGTPLDTPK